MQNRPSVIPEGAQARGEQLALHWEWLAFAVLSPKDLYDILALRQEVFVVEQHCPFLDADGRDENALHLLGRDARGTLLAYLRLVEPGVRFPEPSIGRVITHASIRRMGIGRELMRRGLAKAAEIYSGRSVMISAQMYLEEFYAGFGFSRSGARYDEDGIPHIDMIRRTEE
jgi:ElaA protein